MRGLSRFQQVVAVLIAAIVVVGAFVFLSGGSTKAPDPAPVDTSQARGPGTGTVAEADLPPEGRTTIERIRAGGPYPYSRDGIVFENREGLLPNEPRGYYHEFTVPTPGSSDRGARRIVSASGGFYYYSADHYRTFQQIVLDQ